MTSMKEHLGEAGGALEREPGDEPGYPTRDANEKADAVTPAPRKRLHKATYSSDKKTGGWLVRIVGPHPEKFAGKAVPVVTKNGMEHEERLTRLVWTGNDRDSGEKVGLYKFEAKPREELELNF